MCRLYSAHECIHDIDLFQAPFVRKTVTICTEYIDKNGEQKVMGNSLLKGSQAYTRGFGKALVSVYRKNEAAIKKQARQLIAKTASVELPDLFQVASGHDKWADAKLKPVFDFVRL